MAQSQGYPVVSEGSNRKEPQRILVTGASGLLGINLALEASREHTIFGLVNDHRLNPTISFPAMLSSIARLYSTARLGTTSSENRLVVVQGDLVVPGTVERLLDEIQPDWVIHCAALANLDACEADPAQAWKINTEVPRLLAEHVARGGARLLHVSTDAVFDGLKGNYTETDLPNPTGVYARTKLDAEQAVLDANPEAIVARVNLFGYSLTRKRSLSEFFLYNLQAGEKVMGFTDVFFCPLLANHLGQVFLLMLERGLSGLYHTVSSECLSKYDFGLRIARLFGLDENLILPTSIAQGGLKATRSPNLSLRTDKLAETLGLTLPTTSTGLESFYQLYQDGYPEYIRRLVSSQSGSDNS